MVDMTIKLCQSINPNTTKYTTELHVCKQKHFVTNLYCSNYGSFLEQYIYFFSSRPSIVPSDTILKSALSHNLAKTDVN